ncbi:MAG: BatD family protein, partial [Candidatus Latescibacteria bacterium]|nr:BatD family protein [Candidatus Latescibacterota bacterium]
LYMRYDVRTVKYGHVPTFTGFWAETIFEAQRLNIQRETVDGRDFRVAVLKKLALFPTTAGKHTLEQLEILSEIVIARRSRGLFDFDPFGSFDPFGTRKVTIRSGDVSIEVKPLPAGAPRGFGGAVGQFNIRAEATPTTVKAGDPIAVVVVLNGMGNLHTIAEPTRPEGGGFRFYDPKSNLQTQKQGDHLVGQKTFEYVVIPQRAGQTTLPAFSLSYFDPQNARYQVAKTAPIALRVTPGEQAPEPMAGLRGEEVRALGEDIRYIKPDQTQLVDQSALFYQRGGFWLFQLVPVFGAVGAYAYRRHRERLEGDVAYARHRRSRSEAQRRLGEAKRLMAAGDGAAFHGEIHRSLAQFLADRTNRSAAGLTADQAGAVLKEHGVAGDVIKRVQQVFSQCDMARFAPGRVSVEQMQALYDQTGSLIGVLERST